MKKEKVGSMNISDPSNPKDKLIYPKVAFKPGVNKAILIETERDLTKIPQSESYLLGEPVLPGWGTTYDTLVGSSVEGSFVISYAVTSKASSGGKWYTTTGSNGYYDSVYTGGEITSFEVIEISFLPGLELLEFAVDTDSGPVVVTRGLDT